MKQLQHIFLLALFGLVALLAASQLPSRVSIELPGDPIAGGRIYDNWVLVLDLRTPEGNQPLWDTRERGVVQGPATWLCATCHGWDYKGDQGAYGPSSPYYTGFSGVQDVIGASQDSVLNWLDGSINPQHNFTRYFDTTAANDVAAFLRTQQLDLDLMIDRETGLAIGNDEIGRQLYVAQCAECHGDTGRGISFTTGSVETYLGDVANTNPWRSVHKIRFGLPAGGMPATEELGWSLARVADLLAFLQTMPRGNPGLPLAQGEVIVAGDLENQGDIQPVVRVGLLIAALILIPLAWDTYIQSTRPSKQ